MPNKKRSAKLAKENMRLRRRLKDLSSKDPLTRLHNYQYFIQRLDTELKHAKRYIFPFSIIIVDIDYFKSINDTYGYHIGNGILKEFARYLKKFARTTDIMARYGGATFALLSLNTNKDGAVSLAHRLCEKIQGRTFSCQKTKIKLKVSIGVINFPDDGIDKVPELIDAVDSVLHEAKEQGGNRICAFEAKAKKGEVPAIKEEAVEDLKIKLKSAGKKLDQALLESVYAFAKAIEARDHYTGEHAEKTITIVRAIGKELGLSKKRITNLEHAAVLHDLGKIGIDDSILRKKAKLTKKEYEEIKKHPVLGAEIVRSIHFLKDVVPMILYHHERYDGKGYAAGLKGKEIPLGARILAIADVYQALISDRPYRKAYTKKEALKIIKKLSGKQFDPEIVDGLIKSLKEKKKVPK